MRTQGARAVGGLENSRRGEPSGVSAGRGEAKTTLPGSPRNACPKTCLAKVQPVAQQGGPAAAPDPGRLQGFSFLYK